MKYKVERTDKFTKSFKKLAKRYQKIAIDYAKLIDILEKDNHNAVEVAENIYKIRLQNTSNPQGKSSGFRVIYFLKTDADTIYLLDIFSKNKMKNIKKHTLIDMAKEYRLF